MTSADEAKHFGETLSASLGVGVFVFLGDSDVSVGFLSTTSVLLGLLPVLLRLFSSFVFSC